MNIHRRQFTLPHNSGVGTNSRCANPAIQHLSRSGIVFESVFNGNGNDQAGGFNLSPSNISYATNDSTLPSYQLNCASFNATNSMFEVSGFTPMDGKNVGTYMAAFYPTTFGQGEAIITQGLDNNTEKSGIYGYGLSGAQKTVVFSFGGADIAVSMNVANGLPIAAIGVADGTNIVLYVNGVPTAPVANTRTLPASSSTFRRLNVGKHYWPTGESTRYGGRVTEARIFNRPITSEEAMGWTKRMLASLH